MQIISFLISCLFLCSNGDFFTILDLPEGEHQYKFYVDGQWVHDPNEVIEVSLLIQRSSSNECFALCQKIVLDVQMFLMGVTSVMDTQLHIQ